MRRSLFRITRRKWSQRTWSPTASSGGAAPTNGVSAQEALHITYRPMPLPQTVEYEEDFGHNIMIHREFISKRQRDAMSFEMSALTYSDLELRHGRQHLAGIMNRERRGVSVGAAGAPDDQVQLQTDVDANTREVTSARFLFNEKRLNFCDRFQAFFRSRLRGTENLKGSDDTGDDTQSLFSLMEACAVIYGCETSAAREACFHMFLALDLDSLEQDEEELQNRMAEADLVRQELKKREQKATSFALENKKGRQETGEAQLPIAQTTSIQFSGVSSSNDIDEDAVVDDAFIASIPELSLFADVDREKQVEVEKEEKREIRGIHVDGADSESPHTTTSVPADSPPSLSEASLPEDFEEYAPMYRAYLAHSSGKSRIATYDLSSLGSTGIIAERRRWRALMDMIVKEEYHKMTEVQQMDALVLNGQLHTVKFFDLKVGDTVREILQLHQQETGRGSSLNRDTPLEVSPNHPERRV